MPDVKISADLSDAIERLSEKLGIAANAIIPEYTKSIFINGIAWIVGGGLMALIPWLLFWPITNPGFIGYDSGVGNALVMGFQWAVCLGGTLAGLHTVFDHIEDLLTPKACAIRKLLSQITYP